MAFSLIQRPHDRCVGLLGVWNSQGNIGLQCEAGYPIYMVLLGSGAATIDWLRLQSWHVVKENPWPSYGNHLFDCELLPFICYGILIHFLICFQVIPFGAPKRSPSNTHITSTKQKIGATLFLLPNIGRRHSILRIWNGVIQFSQIPEPNATLVHDSMIIIVAKEKLNLTKRMHNINCLIKEQVV
jgi:hypothetical protein